MRQRIRRLEEKCESLQEERIPLQEMLEEIRRISQLEGLTQPLEDYRQWLSDLQKIPEKEAESFCETLDKLYWKSKRERQNHFAELSKILSEKADKTIKVTAEGGSSDEG